MGVIGEIDRLSINAWAPGGHGGGYIASGTYAGAIDPSFASGACLELLSVDIQNSRLSVVADCGTTEKFCSLDWSNPLRSHPAGLIAGGFNDGTVRVWDAAVLLRSPKGTEDEEKGVVFGSSSFPKKHDGPVRGVCFNSFSPHMLATGSADTKILIWDLSNPTQGPTVRAPGAQQTNAGPSDEVTAIQWNRRVPHILGTGTAAGMLRIWDFKQRRQVISIPSPSSRMRCSGIHWHPDIATQVLTTCDQDNGYGALLWDLRSPAQPILTLKQFASRGVSSASWCPQDAEMILVCTRDPKSVIVSSSTGQALSELQSPSPNFDVQWSSRIPGMFLTCSIDARLTVRSLLTADASRSVSLETANALAESFGEMATGFKSGPSVQSPRIPGDEKKVTNITRPPKWLRRSACVSFGSNGFYTSVSSKDKSTVTVAPLMNTLEGLKESLADVDSVLETPNLTDPTPIESLCRGYISSCDVKDDAMVYEVICCLLQKNSRQSVLKYLGYKVSEASTGAASESNSVYGLPLSNPLAAPARTEPGNAKSNGTTEETTLTDEVGQTSNIVLTGPAPWEEQSDSILDESNSAVSTGNGHMGKKVSNAGTGELDNGFEGMSTEAVNSIIRQSVVTGDLKKAVEACIFVGRTSDALVIAQAGGPSLWALAQSHYLASIEARDSRSVISAITGPKSKLLDFMRSVDNRSKGSWKEALAMILTYVPGSELTEICTSLGQRLLHNGCEGPALICFLCAGNTEMAVATWMRRDATGDRSSYTVRGRIQSLTSLVRKIRLITAMTLLGRGDLNIGSVRALDETSGRVLCEFGALLTLSGDYDAALSYLSNLDPEVTCVYGSAGDVVAKASSAISVWRIGNENSAAHQNISTPYDQSNYGAYGGMYYEAADPSAISNWNNQPSPVQKQMNGGTVERPLPTAPPMGYQQSYATSSQTSGGGMYDPSIYASAPSYATSSYSSAMPAPPAPVPVPTAPVPVPVPTAPVPVPVPTAPAPVPVPTAPVPVPSQLASLPVPPAPMMPLQESTSSVPPPSGIGHTSSMPNSRTTTYPSVSPMQTLPPPPPPPSDAQMPTPYHANAKPGSGHNLPPSAEVAVAQQRRGKPMSVSSSQMGPPRRSNSSSSSLSSAGGDPNPFLDKADVSSVPGDQMIIVKSLRGAYGFASKRSSTTMYRKKMEDVNKKLGRLLVALNKGTVDTNVIPHLVKIGQFIENGKYDSASEVVGTLTRQYWDNNSSWIQALKRLIDCVLTGR